MKISTDNTAPETPVLIRYSLHVITALYFMMMFAVYPLYINRNYINLSNVKLSFFFFVTLILLCLTLILFLIVICKHYRYLPAIFKKFIMNLSVVDWFVLLYALSLFSSFLLSDYKNVALLGTSRWMMGLATLLLFCYIYFLISKNIRFRIYLIYLLLITSFVINLIGVIQRLGYNIFSLYDSIAADYQYSYLSTIGNNNWFAGYFCVTFPMGLLLYCRSSSKKETYMLALYTVIGSFAMIAQRSESVFLGMMGVFIFTLWFSYDSYNHIKKYLQLVLICMVSFRLYGLLHVIFKDTAKTLEWSADFLCKNPIMLVATLLVCLLYYIICLCEKRKVPINAVKKSRFVIYLIFAVSVIAVFTLLFLINCTNLLNDGTELQIYNYFKVSDEWGSGRGAIWKHAIKTYRGFSLREKIFGCGPDCFTAYSYDVYGSFMRQTWGSRRLTNAHNEFLTSIINIGLFGTIAYYGILISSLVTSIKNRRKDPVILAAAACVIAYIANSMVSFQHIVSTPLLFMLIAVISNLCKSSEMKA